MNIGLVRLAVWPLLWTTILSLLPVLFSILPKKSLLLCAWCTNFVFPFYSNPGRFAILVIVVSVFLPLILRTVEVLFEDSIPPLLRPVVRSWILSFGNPSEIFPKIEYFFSNPAEILSTALGNIRRWAKIVDSAGRDSEGIWREYACRAASFVDRVYHNPGSRRYRRETCEEVTQASLFLKALKPVFVRGTFLGSRVAAGLLGTTGAILNGLKAYMR